MSQPIGISLRELPVTGSDVLDILLATVVVVGVALLVLALLRRVFRFLGERRVAPEVTRVFAGAAEEVVAAVGKALAATDPGGHEDLVAAAARDVYRVLPEYLPIKVGLVTLEVPLKLLVGERLFVELVLALYYGVDSAHDSFRALVAAEVEYWRQEHGCSTAHR